MQRQFVCKYCGKTFSSPQALSGHIGRAHSPKKKKEEKIKKYLEEQFGKKDAYYLFGIYKKLKELETEDEDFEDEELEDEEESEEEEEE